MFVLCSCCSLRLARASGRMMIVHSVRHWNYLIIDVWPRCRFRLINTPQSFTLRAYRGGKPLLRSFARETHWSHLENVRLESLAKRANFYTQQVVVTFSNMIRIVIRSLSITEKIFQVRLHFPSSCDPYFKTKNSTRKVSSSDFDFHFPVLSPPRAPVEYSNKQILVSQAKPCVLALHATRAVCVCVRDWSERTRRQRARFCYRNKPPAISGYFPLGRRSENCSKRARATTTPHLVPTSGVAPDA